MADQGVKKPGPVPYRVQVRGKIYANVYECAEAFNVTPQNVWGAINRGRADYIGLGRSRKHIPNAGKGSRKPFKIGSTVFLSQTAASLALGLAPDYIGKTLSFGSEGRRACLARRMMQYAAKHDKAVAATKKKQLAQAAQLEQLNT